MRRLIAAIALVLALAPAAPCRADVDPPPAPVRVDVDRARVSVLIGDRFSFTTTLHAPAGAAYGLVAHLNIVSLDPETYVDPEDWSGERTRYVAAIPAGGAVSLSWTVQAVNHGSFIVYVALARAAAGQPVTAGPGLRTDVAAAHVIDPSGVLPIAAGVPAGVLVALLATRVRHRRRS